MSLPIFPQGTQTQTTQPTETTIPSKSGGPNDPHPTDTLPALRVYLPEERVGEVPVAQQDIGLTAQTPAAPPAVLSPEAMRQYIAQRARWAKSPEAAPYLKKAADILAKSRAEFGDGATMKLDSEPATPDALRRKWSEKSLKDGRIEDQDALVKRNTSDILNETDVKEIYDYMSSGKCYPLNYALREDIKLTDEQLALEERLDAALDKLPDYKGIVYRSLDSNMIEDLDAFLSAFKVGKPIRMKAYTSTGKTVYDESMDIQLIIEVKTGKDITKWNPKEEEVLLRRGTSFLPIKIEGKTMYLREV